MDAEYRVRATLEWIEYSGPCFVDMDLIVRKHTRKSTHVEWVDDPGVMKLTRANVSYAGWFQMRASEPGKTIRVKLRCDEVASR